MRFSYLHGIGAAALLVMSRLSANPGGEGTEVVVTTAPWLTGPLFAPSPYVIPKDHFDIQPYLFYTVTTGVFDSHWHAHSTHHFKSVSLQVPFWLGLSDYLDVQVMPQAIYNTTQGKSSTRFGDIPIQMDFQLYTDSPNHWYPAVKLTLKWALPTGKYQRLDPDKLGTDSSGFGCIAPGIGIVVGHLYHFPPAYPWALSTRLALFYTVSTPVRVKGFNAYGGGFKTHGTVFPGNNLAADLGFELTLTKNWAFALDVLYTHNDKQRFSGRRGKTILGTPAVMKAPSLENLSIAPAIEYNWSANMGLIGGGLITLAARNDEKIYSWILSFNYYL